MPILLTEFLTGIGVDPGKIAHMVESLYQKPPNVTDTKTHPAYSSRLKTLCADPQQNALALQETIIVERAISMLIRPQKDADVDQYVAIFGEPLSEEDQKQNLAILKAALFDIFHVGNCAIRASYAAVALFHALPQEKINIYISSFPEKDHFVVMLGLKNAEKKIDRYAYDTITDPERLFLEEEYSSPQNSVLSAYPKVSSPARQYTLMLTAEFYTKYCKTLPRIHQFFRNHVNSLTLEDLQGDVNFLMSIARDATIDPRVFSEKLGLAKTALTLFKAAATKSSVDPSFPKTLAP